MIAPGLREVGETIAGRYRVEALLGEGGFGAVYAATDLESGQGVALKCLHPHLSAEPDIVARFRREARAATSVGHPGIVQVHDFVSLSDGTHVMVMERLEGEDLSDHLARVGPMRVSDACRLLIDVCEALGVAHAIGIVHRDLKPDNLFLPADPEAAGTRVKLLDFGISKFLDRIDSATLMTKTGAAMGTPYYMSPEQAQGKKGLDARADIYSLGVILFRLLTEQHPFEDDSFPLLIVKICTEPPPKLRTYRMDVPARLDALLARMLAKDPAERPATCLQLAESLSEFIDHDVTPVSTPGAPTKDQKASALNSPLAHAPTALSGRDGHHDDIDLDEAERRAVGDRRSGRALQISAAILVVLALAVVLLAVLGTRPERTDDPRSMSERPDLPNPTPPDVAPLRVPPPSELGWVYEHPRPRAMPSWRDVAVGGAGLVGLVGNRGQAARFEQGRLIRWATGTERDLAAFAWVGPDTAYVVGAAGTMRRLRPDGFDVVETHTAVDLRDVVVVGGTEAVVVGDEGTLLRVRGRSVTPMETGVSETLFASAAHREGLFVVGQRGVILRVEGDAVRVERSARGPNLRGVGGCPRGDLYAVGDEGLVLRRLDDGSWRRLSGPAVEEREGWNAVACDEGRAAISGDRGSVLLASGDESVRFPSADQVSFRSICGMDGAATWAVGDAGKLALLAHDHLILLTDGTPRNLLDAAELGGRLFAVGEWGTILRQDEVGFSPIESGTDAGLSRVRSLDEQSLLAVGDQGVLVRIRHDGVELLEAPTRASLRDFLVDDAWMIAVGSGGTVVRGPLAALQTTRIDGVSTLWALAGDAEDAIAVGDSGSIVRLGRLSATRLPCRGAADLGLRAIAALGDGEFLVAGTRGAILRVAVGDPAAAADEVECVVEREPEASGPTLFAIGRGHDGALVAVGQDGVAFVRDEGGQWSPLDLGIDMDLDIYGTRRTARDVWLVGAGGAVLRHPRTDIPSGRAATPGSSG